MMILNPTIPAKVARSFGFITRRTAHRTARTPILRPSPWIRRYRCLHSVRGQSLQAHTRLHRLDILRSTVCRVRTCGRSTRSWYPPSQILCGMRRSRIRSCLLLDSRSGTHPDTLDDGPVTLVSSLPILTASTHCQTLPPPDWLTICCVLDCLTK